MVGSRNSTSQEAAPPVVLRRSTRVAEASQRVSAGGYEGRNKRLRTRQSMPAQTRIKVTQKQNAKTLDKISDSVNVSTQGISRTKENPVMLESQLGKGLDPVIGSTQARSKTTDSTHMLEPQLAKSLNPVIVSAEPTSQAMERATMLMRQAEKSSNRGTVMAHDTSKAVETGKDLESMLDKVSDSVNVSMKARMKAVERARILELGLDSGGLSFVKPIRQRHGTGLWLNLPEYTGEYLPKHDCPVTLVDDNEVEYPTVYHDQSKSLGNGWRKFSDEHDIVDGDALVFHSVKPTEFKVYIIRVHSPGGDVEHQTSHSCSERTDQSKHMKAIEKQATEHQKTPLRETLKVLPKQESLDNGIEVI